MSDFEILNSQEEKKLTEEKKNLETNLKELSNLLDITTDNENQRKEYTSKLNNINKKLDLNKLAKRRSSEKRPISKKEATDTVKIFTGDNILNKTPAEIAKEAENNLLSFTPSETDIIIRLPEFPRQSVIEANGGNLDDVNDGNVNDKVTLVINNPEFRREINRYAAQSNFGKFIISNLPKILILSVLITLLVFVIKGQVSVAAAAASYAQTLSGCYMIYGDDKDLQFVKLDGCSDWYSKSIENSLKCSCNSISEDVNCTGDDKDLPYCIGQSEDTSGGNKCINPNDKNDPPKPLLKCQGEVGKVGTFVRYTSNLENGLSFISKIIDLMNETTNTANKTKNNNIMGIVLTGVVITITLLILGLTIYNVFFQNKLKTLRI